MCHEPRSASAHWHDLQKKKKESVQQHFSIEPFHHLESSRSQTGFFFVLLAEGAVCNVSGKQTRCHQSQSGPFISFALHIFVSVFDPVCVCHAAPVLLAESQRDKKSEGVRVVEVLVLLAVKSGHIMALAAS